MEFHAVNSLVNVAMGREPADLVIRNGKWACVQSGEVVAQTDIAIKDGRVALVASDARYTVGDKTRVIQADGRYLVPGLLDAHMHVESGMLTITEFVRAVIPHGTTGMFIDPHEIANVFGLQGVRLMVDEARHQPIHVWVQAPSCVPSAPGLETPGAEIRPEDVAEALSWPGIIGLGEVMNFPGVAANEAWLHQELAATRKAGKVIGGHYASPDLGRPFAGYVAGGAQDDHEGTRLEDAVARIRQGMKVMMRFGSAWHDVAEQVRAVTELGLDPRHFLLCTDDSHSYTLVKEGHVNRALRVAIESGVPPMTALQMATLNTAEHFHVDGDIGQIAPGRFADILIMSELPGVAANPPEMVIAKGTVIAKSGRVLVDLQTFTYPDWVRQSVRLAREVNTGDFRLAVSGDQAQVSANVIGIIENQAPNQRLRYTLPVMEGEVQADLRQDIAKIALLDRHRGAGVVQVGLVHGFGFTVPCAVGTTVAHDCHQMVIVGTDDGCMAMAANELKRIGGGQVVVKEGEVIGKIELPIAGLMSSGRAEEVARQAATILDGFRLCGCSLNNPNMQLSLSALPVIPDLRITDLGLVDVNRFSLIPVIESENIP